MKSIFVILISVLILSACSAAPSVLNTVAVASESPNLQPTDTSTSLPASTANLGNTATQAMSTDLPATPLPAQTSTPSVSPGAEATQTSEPTVATIRPATPRPGGELLIDHRAVDLFDKIPASYIQKASAMRIIFRHNSVGWYMSRGLDCLMNKEKPRPSDCDAGIPADQILYDPKYDRSNWKFEFNSDECPDSAWWFTVTCFISRFDALSSQNAIDGGGFKFGFTQTAPDLGQYFFTPLPNDWRPSIHDLEDLEARHPDKIIFYTTSAIPAPGYANAFSFNKQMRSYAAANQKILFDIADIESHLPDGSPCIDPGNGIEMICTELTFDAGHPNALGMQRLAKAFWVLMARINGWDGNPG